MGSGCGLGRHWGSRQFPLENQCRRLTGSHILFLCYAMRLTGSQHIVPVLPQETDGLTTHCSRATPGKDFCAYYFNAALCVKLRHIKIYFEIQLNL